MSAPQRVVKSGATELGGWGVQSCPSTAAAGVGRVLLHAVPRMDGEGCYRFANGRVYVGGFPAFKTR